MSVATVTSVAPARSGLVMPDCDCGMCAPTWARRRGKSKRFTVPVTLVSALEEEDPARRAAMVAEHRECLSSLVCAVDERITLTPWNESGTFCGRQRLRVAADQRRRVGSIAAVAAATASKVGLA
jgi:hypothetical protein